MSTLQGYSIPEHAVTGSEGASIRSQVARTAFAGLIAFVALAVPGAHSLLSDSRRRLAQIAISSIADVHISTGRSH